MARLQTGVALTESSRPGALISNPVTTTSRPGFDALPLVPFPLLTPASHSSGEPVPEPWTCNERHRAHHLVAGACLVAHLQVVPIHRPHSLINLRSFAQLRAICMLFTAAASAAAHLAFSRAPFAAMSSLPPCASRVAAQAARRLLQLHAPLAQLSSLWICHKHCVAAAICRKLWCIHHAAPIIGWSQLRLPCRGIECTCETQQQRGDRSRVSATRRYVVLDIYPTVNCCIIEWING